MLQKLDSEIRECYRHAAECSRRADESQDSFTRQDFLDAEKRWLCLARSYEFAERLSNFTEPARRRNPGVVAKRIVSPCLLAPAVRLDRAVTTSCHETVVLNLAGRQASVSASPSFTSGGEPWPGPSSGELSMSCWSQ